MPILDHKSEQRGDRRAGQRCEDIVEGLRVAKEADDETVVAEMIDGGIEERPADGKAEEHDDRLLQSGLRFAVRHDGAFVARARSGSVRADMARLDHRWRTGFDPDQHSWPALKPLARRDSHGYRRVVMTKACSIPAAGAARRFWYRWYGPAD